MYRDNFIARPKPAHAYRMGWAALKKYFLEFLLVTLVIGAIGSVGALFSRGEGYGSSGLSVLLGIFLTGPLYFGGSYFYLRAMRGDDFEVSDIFIPFRENYIQVVLASFLYATLIAFGFLLLIIPGFIVIIRLSFVPFLVMDEQLDPVEAIKTSWDMTRDFSWSIFFFGLMAFGIAILGLIFLVIGVIPAAIMIQASFAAYYLGVRDEFEVVDDSYFGHKSDTEEDQEEKLS